MVGREGGRDEGSVGEDHCDGSDLSSNLTLLLSARAQVQTVATPSNQFGVVVGAKGTVYVTQDGGFTWKQEKLELDNNLDL
eukprot:751648-Hanusia_phi.AAC.4